MAYSLFAMEFILNHWSEHRPSINLSTVSYEYAFSRYTIITHLCSRASPAVYTKSDDMTHLFLETTCSLLSLRVIMWKLINALISSW